MLVSESNAWTPRQRAIVVGAVVVAAILLLSVLVYCYQHYHRGNGLAGAEQVQDLGFGFQRVTIAKSNKGQVGHYPFLFYRDRLLCQIGPPPSISPSGEFAIYQDARSGKLILFRRRDEKTTELTKAFIGPASYVWHEDQGNVEVAVKEGLTNVFPLQ